MFRSGSKEATKDILRGSYAQLGNSDSRQWSAEELHICFKISKLFLLCTKKLLYLYTNTFWGCYIYIYISNFFYQYPLCSKDSVTKEQVPIEPCGPFEVHRRFDCGRQRHCRGSERINGGSGCKRQCRGQWCFRSGNCPDIGNT